MVFFTEKPILVLAPCCKVEVIKGALGLDLVGLSSRFEILKTPDLKSSSALAA